MPGRQLVLKGRTNGDKEVFEFTIEHSVPGGFLLSIRYQGDGDHNITGAGIWPSIEKAKEIAEETAR